MTKMQQKIDKWHKIRDKELEASMLDFSIEGMTPESGKSYPYADENQARAKAVEKAYKKREKIRKETGFIDGYGMETKKSSLLA
jgi:hypothetical protein